MIDNREKILILAQAPHPDIASIRETLEEPGNYEVNVAYFERGVPALKPYSMVILHGYNNHNAIKRVPIGRHSVLDCKSCELRQCARRKISGGLGRSNDAEPFAEKSFGLFGISDEPQRLSNNLPGHENRIWEFSAANGHSDNFLNKN